MLDLEVHMLRATTLFAAGCLVFQLASAAEEAPLVVTGAKTVSAVEAKALYDKRALFLDPRPDPDWEAGRIPGAVHLELKSALTREALAKHAKPGDPIVVYCNGVKCLVSSHAIEKIRPWGYVNLHYLREGLPGWKAARYPVE